MRSLRASFDQVLSNGLLPIWHALRSTLRCQEERMLPSVHGTHSNNLSADVDRNGSLQFPTRIGGNKSVQIPHSAFCAPDKCV